MGQPMHGLALRDVEGAMLQLRSFRILGLGYDKVLRLLK
jgi:hypothetical protein